MTEFRIGLHVPILPQFGEDVFVEGAEAPQKVAREFSRIAVGSDRFAVRTRDGGVFEIELAEVIRPNGRHSWRAVRAISEEEFAPLGKGETRNDPWDYLTDLGKQRAAAMRPEDDPVRMEEKAFVESVWRGVARRRRDGAR